MITGSGQTLSRHADSAAARYESTRARTLALTRGLSAEDQALQSMPDASPVKWHLAHTTWFFETFLLRDRMGYRPFDARFGEIFNSYYNAVGAQHPRNQRGLLSRPSLDDVHAYRAHVDEAMMSVADEADPHLLSLGLAHEEQHQELILMDVQHLFSLNPLAPAIQPRRRRTPSTKHALGWVELEGGLFDMGFCGEGFAFDNETPLHKTFVAPFALADRLTTAAEYQTFMEDGGYQRPDLWLSDGWDAVVANDWRSPLYWRRTDESWMCFTLSGLEPINSQDPVRHVSYYEADAFARWSGKRLPTESEWEFAATTAAIEQKFDVAWQWTSSAYGPYPGYRPADGALGEYNGKFMSGQMVLRGGSIATPPGHTRATYRNFFPPGARWVFSGIRLASDE
jgi:ergothioneine biosynthesis protein EgtB